MTSKRLAAHIKSACSDLGPLTFGFDIGIASVGWAVLNHERIIALGVRAFDRAENEKGEPLNKARREKRTARTRLGRRALRLKKARRLMRDAGLIPSAAPEYLATPPRAKHDQPNDPWILRVKGLAQRLSPQEWARVLYHLIKHRGFYAARKSETADEKSEGGKLSQGVAGTSKLLHDNGYQSIGEMAVRDPMFAKAIRNKQGSYTHSFSRKLLREELALLFTRQRVFGNPQADESLAQAIDELFWHQKPALSGQAMLNRLGHCTFEPKEHRAAKNTWRAERFVWLTRLNNLRIIHQGERRPLSPAERQLVLDLPYQKNEVSYKDVRKLLAKHTDFPDEAGFAGLSYRADQKKSPEDQKLAECKGWHELRKAFEKAGLTQAWQRMSQDHSLLDDIATAIAIYKTDEELKTELNRLGLSPQEAEALLPVSLSGFIHLSLAALHKILPGMETGARYDEACTQAGYNHTGSSAGERHKTLPPLNPGDLRNPVVFRALNQARKVLNALVSTYGSPTAVHIELGRDLSKSLDERKQIEKGQSIFRDEKEVAAAKFRELFGRNPKGQDLLKMRLYDEQGGKCAYSLAPLDLERITEVGYVEVDHALPYSRSFDDSQNNKVLALTKENREKGNRTPFEYFGHDEARWHAFEVWVRSHKGFRKAKRDRLLRRVFDEREAQEFSERNLNDTRYATRFFAAFIRDHLAFAEGAGKQPILTPSGSFTSFLRTRFGLVKNREESDLHHALDACVIAAASPALIKRVSDFHRRQELVQLHDGQFADRHTGEILSEQAAHQMGEHFPKPWAHFREEVLGRLSSNPQGELYSLPTYPPEILRTIRPVWVSRAPKRRNGGPIHQETIRSKKLLDKGLSYVSCKLVDLKFSDLENIVGAYRLSPDGSFALDVAGQKIPDPRNEALIEGLRQRLEAYGGDGKKAFAQDFFKPSGPGKPAPLVRTVKLLSTQKGGVVIRGGIADQASMWRVDVFEKSGKFYLVPIYQSDRKQNGQLPDLAATAGKPRSAWPRIDESYGFKFSLCLNDPIRISSKDTTFVGYFAGLDISTAAIHIWSQDRNIHQGKDGLYRGIGTKTAKLFEKFHVDVLGNLFQAKQETRRGLA